MKRLYSLAFLALVFCSCSLTTKCGDTQDTSCTRVLFIGNSYTFVNDLPNMFAKLARSGGNKVEVGMSAQGGWTLSEHLQSTDTLHWLNSGKWKFVVLQEQSQIPSVGPSRTQGMYPAARELVKKIREIGATPIFFVTWARRDGWPERSMNTYESMQVQINYGYTEIAQELNAPIAPVGAAWLMAVQQYPNLVLWQEDGSHPTEQGTYLAACVFYAVIFHESPNGLSYRASLSSENANLIQSIASSTVLNSP